MKNSRTIFDYILDNLIELESEFLELRSFVQIDDPSKLYFDTASHHFKVQEDDKIYTFQIELKKAMEDITAQAKRVLKYMQPLFKELNREEIKKINERIYRLSTIIYECYIQIVRFSEQSHLPLLLKNGILYLAGMMKNIISECNIMEIEIFDEQLERDVQEISPCINQEKSMAKALLNKITKEVDQTLDRLPFRTSEEDRNRIIEERYREQAKAINFQTTAAKETTGGC